MKKWLEFSILYFVLIVLIIVAKLMLDNTYCEVRVYGSNYNGTYSDSIKFWNEKVLEYQNSFFNQFENNSIITSRVLYNASYNLATEKYKDENYINCDIFAFLRRK